MNVLLIVAANAVPVAGVKVGTVHTAYELTYNTPRLQANRVALDHLAVRLQVECDLPGIFRVLW